MTLKCCQNRKMAGSPIVMCPEIERADPCIYFERKFCPNCYAKKLWPMRRKTWSGKSKTPSKGVIRLGTWREILPKDFEKFKQLFPTRKYFLITRGLLPMDFYRVLDEDELCLNIQISVDILSDGRVIPPMHKLSELLTLRKCIFRFKTLKSNAVQFVDLAKRLGIPYTRILETPLRLPNGHKLYDETPLSEILPKHRFFRCNTKCSECARENGVIVCCINLHSQR